MAQAEERCHIYSENERGREEPAETEGGPTPAAPSHPTPGQSLDLTGPRALLRPSLLCLSFDFSLLALCWDISIFRGLCLTKGSSIGVLLPWGPSCAM